MKKLANLKPGAYFFYGGVQWVVLENNDKIGATLAIAAEPVFNRAFDAENRNDWRVSSLRRELNGPFFDALIAEGANRAAFLDWESDLTADDGMTDYGTATDKIALLSDGLYRKYRQYNYLNSNGIVTALNFIGGYVLWGDETACFPADTDVKNYFICVSRMFGWVANSLVLTYWSKVDKKMTRRLIDSIVDSVNIWLNGLVNEEKLLGGRVEFREEENPVTSLMAGKATFHIFLTPPSPMRECEFVLEYDVEYVSAALTA